MQKLPTVLALSTTVLVLAVSLSGCEQSDPDSPAFKRRQAFKQIVRAAEPLGKMARGKDPYQPDTFIDRAHDLQQVAGLPWDHFSPPQPTDREKTRAKPEIWQQPDKFEAKRQDFIAAVNGVVAAGDSRSLDRVRPAVEKLENACMSCHKAFRAD